MKFSLVAIGSAGAQVAEGLLHCAFSGALTREDVIRVSLLCAPREQAERLRGLYAAYCELRGGWGLAPHTSLAPILSLRTLDIGGPSAPSRKQPPTPTCCAAPSRPKRPWSPP